MNNLPFDSEDIKTVGEAHDIAEDRITDYYKFSLGQWKRHQYDVKTLRTLRKAEIAPYAFAILNKCVRVSDSYQFSAKERDFYFICLQDHHIQKALKRDKKLKLLPLLVYIFTHELIHIVRFCNFSQRFDTNENGREKEEKLVHETTFRILENLSLSELNYILDSYERHRLCDMAFEKF